MIMKRSQSQMKTEHSKNEIILLQRTKSVARKCPQVFATNSM